MADARIGVVAIGRNEGERLKACLRSIPRTLPTVYVDSASTDGSAQFAQASGAEVVALDLSRPFTAARARHEGFERLTSMTSGLEYVQFVDGDCEFEPDWLATATARLNECARLAAVCGRRREKYPEASFYNALCDTEWNTPIGEAEACGGDAMFRVSAYRGVGGFDAALIAHEEPELCSRLRASGWKIERIDAPMTRHDAAISRFSQVWRRNTRAGYGYAQVAAKHAGSPFNPSCNLVRRALCWGAALPGICILLSVLLWPYGLLAWLIYPVQVARRAFLAKLGWRPATLELLQKFAETEGILKNRLDKIRRRSRNAIQYK